MYMAKFSSDVEAANGLGVSYQNLKPQFLNIIRSNGKLKAY